MNISEAKTECDRYVRESPRFYDEGTFSIYQFRQTLQQTSQGYDCASMVEAEPAIRQLLKLDFEPKVSTTIRRNFRQTINQTIKTQLLPMAQQQAEKILQYYPQARTFLKQTLEQEAIAKIALNQKMQLEVEQKIKQYNQSVVELRYFTQLKSAVHQSSNLITLKLKLVKDNRWSIGLTHIIAIAVHCACSGIKNTKSSNLITSNIG